MPPQFKNIPEKNPSSKNLSKRKGLIFLIIGIVMVGILCAGYFLWKQDQVKPCPTVIIYVRNPKTGEERIVNPCAIPKNWESSTKPFSSLTESSGFSDWKTYRNEEFGFEFKYPNNWYEDKRWPDISGVSNLPIEVGVNQKSDAYFRAFSRGILLDENLDSWFKKLSKIADPVPTKISTTTIGGKYAIRTEFNFPGGIGYMYFIDNDGEIIEIDYGESEIYNNTYYQILSTFKFTK